MSEKFITQSTGYYGKLPSHGDFIRHNLPRSFIDPWDDWMQQVISFNRTTLQEEWQEYYLTTPLYRFVLAPGICGEQVWMGVVMPSIDSVGRYFPFVLACQLPPNTSPLTAFHAQQAWFEKTESLILTGLEEDFSLANFQDQIISLESLLSEPAIFHNTASQPTTKKLALTLPSQNTHLEEYCTLVLHTAMTEMCYTYSTWQTQGSDSLPRVMSIVQGLPSPSQATAFFTGQWQQQGWVTLALNSPENPIKTEANHDEVYPWE